MGTTQGSGGPGRFIPTDLFLVGLLGLWAVAVGFDVLGTTGQVALGLLAVVFAPGYAAVAALFPGVRANTDALVRLAETPASGDGKLTGVERLLLSVALSVCLVPLLGVGIEFTPWPIQASSLLALTGVVTLLLVGVGAVRRTRMAPHERFDPRFGRFAADAVGRLRAGGAGLTVVLLVGFVVAASGIGFAVLTAEPGEQFTEFYLLSGDEELAGDYPGGMTPGETATVQVGITNNEGERTAYTVVVMMQTVDGDGEVHERETLEEFTVTLDPGETWQEPHSFEPALTGDDVRVTYLLYDGSPPDSPGPDNAYRTVHFWTDVSEDTG